MPNYTVPPGYEPGQGYFHAGMDNFVEWGIKVHVSANSASAQILCNTVLPYLYELKVQHKVRAAHADVEAAGEDNQMRKFITIYPGSGAQLDAICERLNGLISRVLPVGNSARCFPIIGDLAWGHSGYVFIRYGNFRRKILEDDRVNISAKINDYLVHDVDVFTINIKAKEQAAARAEQLAHLKSLGME